MSIVPVCDQPQTRTYTSNVYVWLVDNVQLCIHNSPKPEFEHETDFVQNLMHFALNMLDPVPVTIFLHAWEFGRYSLLILGDDVALCKAVETDYELTRSLNKFLHTVQTTHVSPTLIQIWFDSPQDLTAPVIVIDRMPNPPTFLNQLYTPNEV